MSIQGLVCDVGHVIVQESVLNHVLARLGRNSAARVLYDMNVLADAGEEEVERWVDGVIREKLDAMVGEELAVLQRLVGELPLTPGLPELIQACHQSGVPVMLMGAVPAFMAEAMLHKANLTVQRVAGTHIVVEGGQLTGVAEVCTPIRKAAAVEQWFKDRQIIPDQAVVIGDSIGDLPAMGLVPRQNRIGFNAHHPRVIAHMGETHSGSMYGIIERVIG